MLPKRYEYKFEIIPNLPSMEDLTEYLNSFGKDGWLVVKWIVQDKWSDRLGCIYFCREVPTCS